MRLSVETKLHPNKHNSLCFMSQRKAKFWASLTLLSASLEMQWSCGINFGEEACFESQEEFKAFVDSRTIATFIRFNNIKEVANPLPKTDLAKMLGSLTQFRLGRFFDRETAERF